MTRVATTDMNSDEFGLGRMSQSMHFDWSVRFCQLSVRRSTAPVIGLSMFDDAKTSLFLASFCQLDDARLELGYFMLTQSLPCWPKRGNIHDGCQLTWGFSSLLLVGYILIWCGSIKDVMELRAFVILIGWTASFLPWIDPSIDGCPSCLEQNSLTDHLVHPYWQKVVAAQY
jgi:hypothetical protein